MVLERLVSGLDDLHDSVFCEVVENWKLEGFKSYILCPQLTASDENWHNSTSVKKLKAVIDKVINEYNIDTQNIIISGGSLGGIGSIYAAKKLPEYFSKMVTISGYNISCDGINIPTRGYVGSKDDEKSFEFMKGNFANNFGSSNLFIIDGATHKTVTKKAFNLDDNNNGKSDLIEWLFDNQDSNNGMFSSNIKFSAELLGVGSDMPYVFCTPSTIDTNRATPLILYLHGSGSRDDTSQQYYENAIYKVFNDSALYGFNAYILCPHYIGGGSWMGESQKTNVIKILNKVINEYNIDTKNIIIAGHSMGAQGALHIAYHYPEYFSKVLVLSGYSAEVELNGIKIPVLGFYGTHEGEDDRSIEFMEKKFAPVFGVENTIGVYTWHGNVPKFVFNLDEDKNQRPDAIEWMFEGYEFETTATITKPYGYNDSVDTVSPTTGLDTVTGVILEPAMEFFTVISDFIMSITTQVMKQIDYQFVMVDKDDINLIPDLGEATITYTISDMTPFKSASGSLERLRYPLFQYSPEEIFAGEIDLLDINFIDDSNTDEDWNKIRSVISSWYKIFRMITIIGLLSVLIYTGIKIIISSNAKDKAKYKEMIINWFIAVILAFSLHYIMAFILITIEEIMKLFGDILGAIEVNAGGTIFETNLIGLARFNLQQQSASAKVGYVVVYIALVVYTLKFTMLYLKRVLRMAFLTVISPIVALTYPIDKANDGKAQGFNMWLKEFIFNALLQPLHYLLYYILVSSSMSLAVNNPVYAIVALAFISNAEKLLKKIFGFDKAKAGTVGGIAGAYATGAIAGYVGNFARDPLHPFGGGKKNGKSRGKHSKPIDSNNIEMPNAFKDDADFINYLDAGDGTALIRSNSEQGIDGETNGETRTSFDTVKTKNGAKGEFFDKYRTKLSEYSNEELGELIFKDGDPRSLWEMLQQLSLYQSQGFDYSNESVEELQELLKYRLMFNESGFEEISLPEAYIDGDNRSNYEIMENIERMNLMTLDQDNYSEEERQDFAVEAAADYSILERRMIENQYIQSQGGPQALLNGAQQQATENRKFVDTPFAKGMANVGRTILKPAWDTERSTSYNAKRLVGHAGTLAKAVVGLGVGITAASVQAGISITDGKYNPMEGMATVAAGVTGVMNIGGKGSGELLQAYQEGAALDKDKQKMKKYTEQWYNSDSTINYYNREFPGRGKELRDRAVENYISRGITDLKQQKESIKYAELLRAEKGMSIEEADKLAIATLQYKQNLIGNGNYIILFDKEKRGEYINTQVDTYSGAASKNSIKRLHEDFIQNVRDFDRANR